MVVGIDIFRERLSGQVNSLILIGGAACDQWFNRGGLEFLVTRDLDVVLVAETLDQEGIVQIKAFIDEGKYERKERTEGVPVLYRVSKPVTPGFPAMLEFFSRQPDGLDLGEDQNIVPIPDNAGAHSLSAILLNETYYQMLLDHREEHEGIKFASTSALIALKARAWIDLGKRSNTGEKIDSSEIKKHRNDVFRLAAILPGDEGVVLDDLILDDLRQFLSAFPPGSSEWTAIQAALKSTFGNLNPAALIEAMTSYFKL